MYLDNRDGKMIDVTVTWESLSHKLHIDDIDALTNNKKETNSLGLIGILTAARMLGIVFMVSAFTPYI